MDPIALHEIERAAALLRPWMAPTPQYAWPLLAARTGCEVFVKHENHTPIGAFKVRGGLVMADALQRLNRAPAGIISATRGNHGQSLAFAGRALGIPVTMVVPHGNSPEKNAAMRALGARLLESGRDFDAARAEASRVASECGLHLVSPFAREIVCGVATYALELFQTVNGIDTVYVPVGMGSGICGVIQVRDLLGLGTRIVGVVSERAPAFARSFEEGRIVTTDTADTFADGLACREPLEEAVAVVRRGADRFVRVTDEEVAGAILALYTDTHNLAEGAGAAPLAALLRERETLRGRRVALILSGGNIDLETFRQLDDGSGSPAMT
jgi:threonine dehydratase